MIYAIAIGFIIYMVSGMIYYSLLGNRWVSELEIKPDQPKYGLLTAVTLLTTAVLYFLLQVSLAETLLDGAFIGLGVGVIVSLAYAKDFIFGLGSCSKKPLVLYCIAVGYHLIALTIIGTVMMFFI